MDNLPYRRAGQFGFSNSDDHFASVVQFRDEAVADGWSIKATYKSEPVERSASLSRDGYRMSILARDNRSRNKKHAYEANIHIWGPDGLAVKTPEFYDFARIVAFANSCPECGATGVKTQRVAFANRACAKCAPALRKKLEKPGWNR